LKEAALVIAQLDIVVLYAKLKINVLLMKLVKDVSLENLQVLKEIAHASAILVILEFPAR
jgi:hypothetical protein